MIPTPVCKLPESNSGAVVRKAKQLLCTASVLSASVLGLGSESAFATTLSQSIALRPSFDISGVDARSYDGPAFNAFTNLLQFTDGAAYSSSTFTGNPGGSKLNFFLLAEYACFDGRMNGVANKFGVLNGNGDFVTAIDSQTAAPGAMGMLTQGGSEQFTLALNSPEGVLSSIDGDNPGMQAHILVYKVTKSGTANIQMPLSRPGPAISFNLLEGDCLLFIEDMILAGNNTFGGFVPAAGDFDYNDMVIVLRQTDVPEPTTMMLFGAGALALVSRRRRQSQQSK